MKIGNLYLDIRPGDTVWVGKDVQLAVVQKGSNRLRLHIIAPVSLPIDFVKRPNRGTQGIR